jgi:hypothetical protein
MLAWKKLSRLINNKCTLNLKITYNDAEDYASGEII